MIYQEAIFVRATDWEGLYIGGSLVDQNGMIDLAWSLDGKTISFRVRDASDAVEGYVMDNGGFPSDYEELVALDK